MLIKILNPSTISKIAAGEVIERPASVVKELVENSIDAGSTSIIVKVESGGRNLIEVIDNGCGVHKDDLELAFTQHATSKLNEENLDIIDHLGFRGEALASIASVSRVSMVSRVKHENTGWGLFYESGNLLKTPAPAPMEIGTKVSVMDLFCKTPTRLKFLQSEKTENQHILEIVRSMAIAYNEIEFKLIIDKKVKAHTKPSSSLDRACEILSVEKNERLFEIELTRGKTKISGYASAPWVTSRDASKIYVFVNQRAIRNSVIVNAVRHAYYTLIEKGKYPRVVSRISIPQDEVDVNVHPNKLDVRFRDQKAITEIVIASIKQALTPTLEDRYAKYQENAVKEESKAFPPLKIISPENKTRTESASLIINQKTHNQNGEKPEKEILKGKETHISYSELTSMRDSGKETESAPLIINQKTHNQNSEKPEKEILKGKETHISYSELTRMRDSGKENAKESSLNDSPPKVEKDNSTRQMFENFNLRYFSQNNEIDIKKLPLGSAICQINGTYILAETETELIIVDQHAAHERIIYEQIATNIFHPDKIFRQKLLIPEKVQLDDEYEADTLEEIRHELIKLGFLIERDSGNNFVIIEKPSFMLDISTDELIATCVSAIREVNAIAPIEEKIHEICASISCHNSIRAGRIMTKNEMNALLRKMESTRHADQCNHGRPSYHKVSFSELSSIFKRT